MNLSGEVILKFVKYYKILPENILVIHDDLDMELAKIKFTQVQINALQQGNGNLQNIIKTEMSARYNKIFDKL